MRRMLARRDVDVLVLAAKRRREVALAGVVRHRDDRRKLRAMARELDRRRDVAAGGDAAEDSLLRSEPPRHRQALLGRRGVDVREDRGVQVFGDEPVADALDAVWPLLAAREQRALLGL